MRRARRRVARGSLLVALLGEVSAGPARDHNLLWRHFTGVPSRVVATAEQDAAFESAATADLRAAVGRHPDDPLLRGLIADLRRASPRFESLWQERAVARHASSRKTIRHPQVGPLTLDCDVLTVEGSDLRTVLYTAVPGAPDEDARALLRTIGTQFSGSPS
ncbi:hypothetical protein ACIRF8_11500 [Streptomyces sp. NPDC102406]|uniref:MmyB family transcriptional regulator n=1 Tax=Streptomyces sp. NPDC102406 TaxID=3366171 RepID=UPI0037F92EEF